MDNGQTIYKNRTLTHDLKQLAQETNSLSKIAGLLQVRLAGSQDVISSNNLGNQTISLVTVSPNMQILITDSFSNSYPCFHLRINQRKICTPN